VSNMFYELRSSVFCANFMGIMQHLLTVILQCPRCIKMWHCLVKVRLFTVLVKNLSSVLVQPESSFVQHLCVS
jgi:hypothetical protein